MNLKPYPEYKDSGVEWIGEIPESWEIHRLKYLISQIESGGREKGGGNILDEGVFSLGGEHINWNGTLKLGNLRFISEEYYNSMQTGKIRINDILLVKDGATIGKTAIVNKMKYEKMAVNEHVFILRSNQKLLPQLLYYIVSGDSGFSQIKLTETGSAQGGINQDFPSKVIVSIPENIKEQHKIVSFLDRKTSEIDLTIEKYTRLIELLQEKRTALINHVVTKGLDPEAPMKDSGVEWIGEIPEEWEVKKIKDVASVSISNVDKKSKPDEPDVFLCNYTDVYNNDFITSEINFMKATANFDQIKKLALLKDDVIITKDSESPDDIAVPALVNQELKNVVCGYHLALIRPNKEFLDGNFLFRSLESKKINDQFVVNANGVTRFGISTYPIKNSYLSIPPLKEQIKIVNYLENQILNMDKTIIKINENISLLQEYKKSLIHHVVTGKVNVIKED